MTMRASRGWRARAGWRTVQPAAIEEFVEGHEGFYDTLSVDGEARHDFISHYFPNVLEGMRARWISPQIVATNRMDAPGYEDVREMGRRVSTALGIETAATHMEWFFGPKGLKFSEIGVRPPGVGQWDSYAAGNEFDIYRDWAMAVCHGRTEAASVAALRLRDHRAPAGPGRADRGVRGGVERVFEEFGDLVVGSHFPEPGTPTQGVEAGYMANAWIGCGIRITTICAGF